jgi:hypothetical protein
MKIPNQVFINLLNLMIKEFPSYRATFRNAIIIASSDSNYVEMNQYVVRNSKGTIIEFLYSETDFVGKHIEVLKKIEEFNTDLKDLLK